MRTNLQTLWLTAAGALALGAGGCDWTDFETLEDEASIITYEAPGSYRRSGYGGVVTTFHGRLAADKDAVSRLIGSAGPDSPVVVERVWDGTGFDSGTNVSCKDKDSCEKGLGVGGVLIPFQTWGAGGLQERHGCVLSPGDPNAYVFCETNASDGSQNFNMRLVKPNNTTLAFSGAGLPPAHRLGVALLGVHAVSTRTGLPQNGALYMQPDLVSSGLPPRQLALMDPRTDTPFADAADAGDLGYAVAALPNGAGELVIAVSQPSLGRVIVATFNDATPVDPAITGELEQINAKLQTRACIKSPDPSLQGFGKRVVLGDVTKDNAPEIFVGIDPLDGTNDGKQRVWMWNGSELPAYDADADVCPLWGGEPVQVGCYGGVRGVDCENTAFGASLAIGDVNGDGYGDLLAGAPRADVQGVEEAGTVWIIPGSGGGLDFDQMTNLYAASFEAKGHVGASVGALRTVDRDEPVAGAPGSDTIYMFTCSKLETDLSTKNLCIPK